MIEVIESYERLLRGSALHYAACVAMTDAVTPDEVIGIYGGDPLTVDVVTGEVFSEEMLHRPSVLVAEADGITVMMEPNGFQATRPEIIRALSTGGRAVSVFWNVDSVSKFVYADGGDLKVEFEMLGSLAANGSEPDSLADLIAEIPFQTGQFDFRACGLALAEAVMDTGFPADWETRTYRRSRWSTGWSERTPDGPNTG